MRNQNQISDQELEAALDLLAEFIERYTEKYWPIFDRIESELKARQAKSARLSARRCRSLNSLPISPK